MTDRELMQMALDALEKHIFEYETILALRAALAQPEQEELARLEQAMIEAWKPIPKKEWVGLTDEEIMDACSAVWASHPVEVGKIVQNLLKEKNI